MTDRNGLNMDALDAFAQAQGPLEGQRANAASASPSAIRATGPTPTSSRSRGAFVGLAFFLGVLGIQNFYAGYFGRAIGQVVLSLTVYLLSRAEFGVFSAVLAVILGLWILSDMIFVAKDSRGAFMRP